MKKKNSVGLCIAGAVAGGLNGLLGAGGGMMLIPLLSWIGGLEERELFPASVSMILPVCLVSLTLTPSLQTIPWGLTVKYLIGSAAGGILAGLLGSRIPTLWLHRLLGLLVLWGGIRNLC